MSELDPTASRASADFFRPEPPVEPEDPEEQQRSAERSETQNKKQRRRRGQTVSMFSTLNSKVTTVICVMAMMMMVMMMMTLEAAAMPKGGGHSRHPLKTHRKLSDGATVETVPLQLDPNALVSTKIIRPLQNVSISPWTYNNSHDESLFPPTVSEAHCLLQGCLDSQGREDLTLESRPIMHQVLLLRRVRSVGAGSAGDSYHYQLESRLIAVGCTCVRPNIQRQQ